MAKKIPKPLVILIELLAALVFSFIGLILFAVLGAGIGGNFGFFKWKGFVGYESAGALFGGLGMALGGWAGAVLLATILRQPMYKLRAALAALLVFVLHVLFYGDIMFFVLLAASILLPVVLLQRQDPTTTNL